MPRLTKTSILASCLALLILCGASRANNKSPDSNELSLDTGAVGPANVIKADQPSPALPVAPAESQSPLEPVSPKRRAAMRRWLMLFGVLLVLFLLWLVLFHAIGRRLRKRALRAHAPTPHADIWASHKPPEFLDH